jgi:phosphoribosyl 1,2-cyclic phosphate phosphodiesterase
MFWKSSGFPLVDDTSLGHHVRSFLGRRFCEVLWKLSKLLKKFFVWAVLWQSAGQRSMGEFVITFLGTGTSVGVPVIGCDCPVCLSKDPRDKRLRTSAWIQTPEASFVIDTPPDFRQQCLRAGIRKLDAVLYTHLHSDHILGFDDLRRFCEMEDRGMPVYASPETLSALRRVFSYAFDAEQVFKTYVRPEPAEFHGPFHLGATHITPVRLPHGRILCNGFVFSRKGTKLLAYYTDCHEVPPEAEEAARGAKVLVIDALRYKFHSTHLTIEAAIEVAKRIGAEQTYFIHMCHEVGHEETSERLPPGIMLAYDQLRIEL